MGKESFKDKKNKSIEYHNIENRTKFVNQFIFKLNSIGLYNFNDKMIDLTNNLIDFQNNGTEFDYSFIIEGTDRKCIVKLSNNKNKIPFINLIKF